MSHPVTIGTSNLGSGLQQLLMCDEIQPGASPGYEICKIIYLFHPLGDKIASAPIRMAQSQERDISVPDGPEDDCRKAFVDQWRRDGCDNTVLNLGTQARVYGVSSLALLDADAAPSSKLDWKSLYRSEVSYNVLDPLNTAGSLVTNQNPNAVDFQKHRDIAVNGVRYDRSRTITLMNENPVYIAYNAAAFGFVGRSVYQRALYPLKTFVQTMRADDMVARKVGLIVAFIAGAGSVADRVMEFATGMKRRLLGEGETGDVLSVGQDDKVESLDLTNLQGPMLQVRKDVLENIATAVPMPAKLINNETFAEGFGEGSEDAKHVAEYVEGVRNWLGPAYAFMDDVTMRRAWNPQFYEVVQRKFPDQYGSVPYEEAFYRWKNSFSAKWPSLLREPESELVEIDKVKFETATSAVEVLLPLADPQAKVEIVKWFCDALNDKKRLFSSPLNLDFDALLEHFESTPAPQEAGGGDDLEEEPSPPRAGRADSSGGAGLRQVRTEKRLSLVEDHLRKRG